MPDTFREDRVSPYNFYLPLALHENRLLGAAAGGDFVISPRALASSLLIAWAFPLVPAPQDFSQGLPSAREELLGPLGVVFHVLLKL